MTSTSSATTDAAGQANQADQANNATKMADVVTVYLQAWNTVDADERRALLGRTWTENAVYADPLAEASGLDAVSAVMGQVQKQFTGMRFSPVGSPDGHHRQVRFQWGLGPEGADPLVIGFDVVVLNSDGRIADVRGFLDLLPG